MLETIREEARGTKLSAYITVDGFDIDLLAPEGVEEVEIMDMLNPEGSPPPAGKTPLFKDEHTILRYPIQSIPFPAFAHEIRMQAISVMGEQIHSGTKAGSGNETTGDAETP